MLANVRQNRLKELLGANHHGYVFQIIASYSVSPIPRIIELALRKQYNITANKNADLDFPSHKIGLAKFFTGGISPGGSFLKTYQLVYTSGVYTAQTSEKLIEEDVERIQNIYRAAWRRAAPHIPFYSSDPKTGKRSTFSFDTQLAEYNFEFHPPSEIDALKPCTLIPGFTIRP